MNPSETKIVLAHRVKPSDVKINPIYEKLLPPLPNIKYKELKTSIIKNGLYEKIWVNPSGIVLDGHHRFKILKEIGVEITEDHYEVKEFDNPTQEKIFVIEVNLKRRQLPEYAAYELSRELDRLHRDAARERQKATLPQEGEQGFQPVLPSIEGNIEDRKERESASRTAEAIGSSRSQVERMRKIDKEAPEEVKNWLRNEEVSVHKAYQMVNSPKKKERTRKILQSGDQELINRVKEGKTSVVYATNKIARAEKHQAPPELPDGVFDVIYADPPWKYDLPLRGSPDGHYPILEGKELAKLDIPVAKNAILFLWATNPKLPEALKLMEEWGFDYKTNLVWVKDKIGTGYYFRGKHELLLLGKKGNIPPPMEPCRPPSALIAPRKKHSKKPDEIYELIEKMYPNREYLELFARQPREGWTSWGDEL